MRNIARWFVRYSLYGLIAGLIIRGVLSFDANTCHALSWKGNQKQATAKPQAQRATA